MTDPFAWWLLILGIGIGIGLLWLVIGRIPREQDDVSAEERAAEAAWISGVIGRYGGVAPEPLVEEILELHDQYLKGPALEPAPADAFEPADAFDPAEGVEPITSFQDEADRAYRAERAERADEPDGPDAAGERKGSTAPIEPAAQGEPAIPTKPADRTRDERDVRSEDAGAARGTLPPEGDRRAPAAGPPARTARPT